MSDPLITPKVAYFAWLCNICYYLAPHHAEDVDGDGDLDMMVHFKTSTLR